MGDESILHMSMNRERPSAEPEQNIDAWHLDTYSAWVQRYGSPADVVSKTRKNPRGPVESILAHTGEVRGKRIANLMGSSGVKAMALSMLGADVTVVDISESNARYARELSEAAGLDMTYLVSDVLSLLQVEPSIGQFDIVFAELGIVHYFTNLAPLMEVAFRLLRPNGRFVLRDFHPVSTKLLKYRGPTAKVRKYRVEGDYFDKNLERKPVSFAKHLPDVVDAPTVLWRKWTLGEIVTAVACSGLRITELVEEPNLSSDVFDAGIPKTFTLVAEAVP